MTTTPDFQYTTLSDTERRSLVFARLQEAERDHYNHGLTIQALEAQIAEAPDDPGLQVQLADQQRLQRTAAGKAQVFKADLDALPAPTVP